MHTCSTWSEDVHVVLGLVILPLFFINFFRFFDLVFFPGLISVGIDTLLAQVLLEIFWNYAYLFYMVWRCVCVFWVVLLSYGFKSHNPLLTKPWCWGTHAHNRLLLLLWFLEIPVFNANSVDPEQCRLSGSALFAIYPFRVVSRLL